MVPSKFPNAKVLIAEDNQINAFIMKQLLARFEIDADIAENGQIALDKFMQHTYDLVFMDLHMPVMDGVEATRQILVVSPDAKIVALTASTEEEAHDEIEQVNFFDIISKPVEVDVLGQKLTAYLNS